jgi:glycosyltransferase involved in cell wall biosynthesis
MKQHLLFIAKGMPNRFKSAGDIRALKMLEILTEKYDVTVMASGADYGVNDVRGIGAEPVLNGAEWVFNEINTKKKVDVIILSHWTCGHRYINHIRKHTNVPIILDSIDLEFLRIKRECEWKGTQYNTRSMEAELDIYMKSDLIIVASEIDKIELEKVLPRKKSIVIPCMFDLKVRKQQPETNNVYTACNWLHAPNVDATEWLCEKVITDSVKLHVVGKHPPTKLTRFEKVVFHGWVPHLEQFVQDKVCCVAPILYGAGINGKIGEAISFGVPVITTKLGADPYGLTDDCVFIAKDYIEFKEMLNYVVNHNKLNDKVVNALEVIKKFTPENFKETILSI